MTYIAGCRCCAPPPNWRGPDPSCTRCGGEVQEHTVDGTAFLFCRPCGEAVEYELSRGKFLG